jgi:hypothetical protein
VLGLSCFSIECLAALGAALSDAPQQQLLRLRTLQLRGQLGKKTLLALARAAPGLETLQVDSWEQAGDGHAIAAAVARLPKLARVITSLSKPRCVAALAVAQREHPALRMVRLGGAGRIRAEEYKSWFSCPVMFEYC